jgi:hypothetical protein
MGMEQVSHLQFPNYSASWKRLHEQSNRYQIDPRVARLLEFAESAKPLAPHRQRLPQPPTRIYFVAYSPPKLQVLLEALHLTELESSPFQTEK